MPPKKKSAKADKAEVAGGEAAASSAQNADAQIPEARPEDILELVACRQKLQRTRQGQRELTESNALLREQLSQHKFEQSEIFAYLNKELVQKSKQVSQLETRVQGLEMDVRGQEGEFDNKLMQEKSTAREMTAKLAREVGKYEKELGDLNIFISKKTELENELDETKTELLKERKKHEQIISELEKKTSQEKDRLRRDMEYKIKEAKETFMKMTDSQLESTTKKTMQDNEQMNSELAFQNRETERLLQKNRKLAEENQHTRRELAMHIEGEKALAKRNHAYLKTIQSLLSKLRAVETAKKELERGGKEKDDTIGSAYRNRMKLLQETVEETYLRLEDMNHELEEKTSEVNRLHTLREDLGMFMVQAAEEVKRHLSSLPQHSGTVVHANAEDDEEEEVAEKFLQAQTMVNIVLWELSEPMKSKAMALFLRKVNESQTSARGLMSASPTQAQATSILPPIAGLKKGQSKSESAREDRVLAFESRTEYGYGKTPF